jgi:hypothetical protein
VIAEQLLNSFAYITAAWVIALVSIGAYAASVVVRGRRLSREVPPEQRRWM